ncbi:MAG: hypothetical protein NPINA01_02990 [Nitrospinaceae bacterium]|nr:MAG: hypothetical protein NPINA01_02990 [Nitrospinaceae bacterium]
MIPENPQLKFRLERMLTFLMICLMGIAPVYWFTPGFLMNSEDLRHSPTLEGWLQYFYMWNSRIGTGAESVLDPCLLLFQAIPTTLRWLGLPLWETQMVTFSGWFLVSALSMYGLARRIFPDSRPFGAPLVTVTFYLFNLWQEHVWLGFKPPLVAAYAILPWLISLLLEAVEGSTKKQILFIKIAIASLLLSPIGNNISEALAIALLMGILAGFLIFRSIKNKNFFHTSGVLFQTTLLMAVVNAYWIVPQVIEAWNLAGQGAYELGPKKYIGWLEGQSQYTGFLNVIRFLGDWTWYQGVGEPYRPYAELYRTNWLLIFLSCALPLTVAFGIYKGSCKHKSFFACLTFTGIWLSMGSASLFGFLYQWMFNHIPLFWIARSPYFKFMLLVCIGYAIFLGAFTTWLESRFRNNRLAYFTSTVSLIGMIVVYAYPVATGKTFPTNEERSYLPPSRISPPGYVPNAGKWLDSLEEDNRVFALNEDRFWTTDWGYRGFAPFLVNFTNQPVIFKYVPEKILYAQGSPNQVLPLTNMIHQGIYRDQLPRADRLLGLMNTKWVLHDRSIKYYKTGDSYQSVKKSLERQSGLKPEREFGNYQFYSVDTDLPFVYTSADLNVVDGPEEALGPITQGFWPSRPVFLVKSQSENRDWRNQLPLDSFSQISYNPEGDERVLERLEGFSRRIVFDTLTLEPMGTVDEQTDSVPQKELAMKSIKSDVIGGFFLPEKSPGGTWIWMEKNNPKARHLSVVNPHNKSLRSNFVFDAISFKLDRSLYSYLNGELAQVTEMKGDQSTRIIIRNMEIKPGENIISFYTPFPGTPRGKESLTFGFLKPSFRFQNLVFSGGFQISQSMEMEALVVLMDHRTDFAYGEGLAPYLKINGTEVPLEEIVKNKMLSFGSTVKLNAGKNSFELSQRHGINAAIFFSPLNGSQETAITPMPVYRKINPTHYRLKVSLTKPGYLVVSNSFHRGWSLKNAGGEGPQKGFPHFKANGFANGFFLQKPGNYDLILTFKPQRLLHIGSVISILGIAVFFGIQFIIYSRMGKSHRVPYEKVLIENSGHE